MRTATINVSDSILKWVLQVSSNLLNDNWIRKINNWRSSKKNPTFAQLQSLSKKARLPFGYFFLKEPPKIKLPILHFRTIKNKNIDEPSKELVDTIIGMRNRVNWLKNYRISQGIGKISFVGICKSIPVSPTYYEDVAYYILKYFDLHFGWNFRNNQSSSFNRFGYLRNRLSDYGITVMVNSVVKNSNNRSLDINELRAFVLTDKNAPLIFINSGDSISARLFSLIHELVHLSYGNQELFDHRFENDDQLAHKKMEQQINKIVAEILFPRKLFSLAWYKKNDIKYQFKIERVAKEFGASLYAAAIRAFNLRLINRKIFNQVKEATIEKYKKWEHDRKSHKRRNKKQGGPSYYRVLAYKIDKSLAFDVVRSIRSGDTSYTEGFNLLDVSCAPQLDKLMDLLKEEN